jgi:hypothetical protein
MTSLRRKEWRATRTISECVLKSLRTAAMSRSPQHTYTTATRGNGNTGATLGATSCAEKRYSTAVNANVSAYRLATISITT